MAKRRASLSSQNADELIQKILAADSTYAALQIDDTACTPDLIRSQYVKISRVIHPDKNGHNPKATEAFQKLFRAYDSLREDYSRRSHDMQQANDAEGKEALDLLIKEIYQEISRGDFTTLRDFVERISTGYPELRIERRLVDDAIYDTQGLFDGAEKVMSNVQEALGEVQAELDHMRSQSVFAVREQARSLVRVAILLAMLPVNAQVPMPSIMQAGMVALRMRADQSIESMRLRADYVMATVHTTMAYLHSFVDYVPLPGWAKRRLFGVA